MFCEKCGNELDNSGKFCPRCGSSVSQETLPENKVKVETSVRKRKPIGTILVIVFALVFILIVGITDYISQESSYIPQESSGINQEQKATNSLATTTSWEEFDSALGHFSAQFPRYPSYESQDVDVEGLEEPLKAETYSGEQGDGTTYAISYTTYPSEVNISDTEDILGGFVNGFVESINGELIDSEMVDFGNYKSAEYLVYEKNDDIFFRGKNIIIGQTMYMLLVGYEAKNLQAVEFNRFINSFKPKLITSQTGQLKEDVIFPSSETPGRTSQEKIVSSVVNILCLLSEDGSGLDSENGSRGSGTIVSADGLVLTNNHVIPQNEEALLTPEEGCLVILPDPERGRPKEAYWANPVVLSGISEKYDIAFLEIYDVFTDEDGIKYGEYPKNFDGQGMCENSNVKLGETLRIFGYPAMSGGSSLTITEGIVSSFPEDGLIATSAKIDSGNSGGLAVDKNGCMVGIPSAVTIGEYETMGVILSIDLISAFLEDWDSLLE